MSGKEISKMNAIHDLQHQVQASLLDDDEFRDYGIEVLDSNGIITLRGTVPTREARDRVEAIVRNVHGVTSVINELDVV
jgi:osmotically-inducible protein OsmY